MECFLATCTLLRTNAADSVCLLCVKFRFLTEDLCSKACRPLVKSSTSVKPSTSVPSTSKRMTSSTSTSVPTTVDDRPDGMQPKRHYQNHSIFVSHGIKMINYSPLFVFNSLFFILFAKSKFCRK